MKHCVWIFLVITISSYSQTPGNGVTDIDGNQYNSVIIGTQEWMKENLNVSKYSDGTIIPQVTDPTAWANLTTGAWCYYLNIIGNGTTYGKLYNWYAVAGIHDNDPNTPNKILAPTGWHVASDDEWTILINCLGGQSYAGGRMKQTGTSYWLFPNTGAFNDSGFTGLPGGVRGNGGYFTFANSNGLFWSLSDVSSGYAWYRALHSSDTVCDRLNGGTKFFGMSVRLVNNTLLDNQSIKTNSFNIYPNPAKEQITIDLGNATNVNGWNYKIVNTLGQEVLYGDLNSQQKTVQLNNIKGHGVYFVKMYDSSNNLMDTKKIIIQK